MIESGEKFGKYTLLKRLATGGMAEIYKASVMGVDGREKIVAIKRLHDKFSEDDEFVTMLIDEAKLAVQLRHPNIGQVFDLERIDGQYFIVMEYIDGPDLQQLVDAFADKGRELPLEALVYVAARAAEALHYAHTRYGSDGAPLEVVHRDVSPQNIMIDADGDVKLVDFGIAKARMRAQHTRAGVIKGKFYYMSPEQAHGNELDARSDVYGLGMVLYEVLTGGHPFDDVPDNELINQVRAADYPPVAKVLPRLPQPMISIVDRALERSVERRFESARALQKALEQFARDSLPAFGPSQMAELLRSCQPGFERSAGVEQMASGAFTTSNHSVIYETENGGFEEQKTEVFVRDDADDLPDTDDLESGGQTEMLDWASDADGRPAQSGPSSPDASNHAGEDGVRSRPPSPKSRRAQRGRPSDASPPRPEASDSCPGGDDDGETSPADASQKVNGSGDRTTTAQIHRRLVTNLVDQIQSRPEIIGVVAAGLAVTILAVAAVMAMSSDSPDDNDDVLEAAVAGGDSAEVDDEATLELPVSTKPPGATVYVDGQREGTTPVSLSPLEEGRSYEVDIERDGYESRQLTFVADEQMAPRVVRLESLDGVLRVESKPQGAEIFVNDEKEGVAPVTIMGLDRHTSHQVRGQLSGEEKSVDVEWNEGDDRTMEMTLEIDVEDEQVASARPRPSPAQRAPPPRPGGSSASPSPPSATGDSSSDEQQEQGGALDIFGGDDQQADGRLNVRTDADDSRIYVDGNMVKDDSTLIGHPLAPGNYEVRAYFPSSGTYSETKHVEVHSGETSTVMISK